ncbi:MAG: HD domain-containing phosphohydrolase [Candidatus Gastranaerophilaceae bacterium]
MNKITQTKNITAETAEKTGKETNPIKYSNIVAKINSLNPRADKRARGEGFANYTEKPVQAINYPEMLSALNDSFANSADVNSLFASVHGVLTTKLFTNFTSLGIISKHSECLNIKLTDKIGSVYSSRIFLTEKDNEIIRAINEGKFSVHTNNSFLKIPYLKSSATIVLPFGKVEDNGGVLIIGDYDADTHIGLYQMLSQYFSLFIRNADLALKAANNAYKDNLTNLYSHRHFQELLASEIKNAEREHNEVSVIIFDVNNISGINKEFGHAKGDEVIKTVAEKVTQNIKNQGVAGRYGGDEIAVILPKMNTDEAKYLAEYITYTLSCCMVEGVGPIKVSVGIASYPNASVEQEKILILAEQAMYISKSKGYKNGISTIVSSNDYDFWDDTALNSFASVLSKRHAQIGINFEEELVNKFQNEEISSQNHLIEVVTSLAGAIDAKDEYTKGHSTSVSRYAVALARAMNLPERETERIKLGGLLHDVGKIGIPENVLRKTSKLSDEEWEIMKQHPSIGASKVLQPNPLLHDLIPIVKYHHEQWNGKGYPEGLKGDEIPLAARIVAVADTYHALISDRPYRKGMSMEKACEILKLGAGVQWDPDLVRQFIQIAPSLGTNL